MCRRINMHTHVAPHPGPSQSQRLKPFDLWPLTFWPGQGQCIRGTATHYMATDCRVHSSSRFPFKARTNRQTCIHVQTRLNALPTPAARQPAWIITGRTSRRRQTSSRCRHPANWVKHNFMLDFGPLAPLCENIASSTMQ